ncbi:MAG TPA: CYTH domain-containing protein [Bacillota bacterium]|nr:CYTH domain-containing protein [Bacillota bacterium]HPE39183.1 CYTH domain-containing protein [Bacillota bacterium]
METEIKISFPSKEELYAVLSSEWFAQCILPENERVEEYENQYFDTEESTLRSSKTTVRVRRVNGDDYIHTVKISASSQNGFSQRYEWNQASEDEDFDARKFLVAAASADDPIELLEEALTPVKDMKLIPICSNKFERKIVTAGYGDSIFEICLDTGTLYAGEKTAPICELEVELIQGDARDVLSFGEEIISHTNGTYSDKSKFYRCLSLLSGFSDENR